MKIEVGKRYWKKNGGVSGPIVPNNVSKNNGYVWFDLTTGIAYLQGGCVRSGDDEDREDLVAEYTGLEPQPIKQIREQRRYEIARDCLAALLPDGNYSETDLKPAWAVSLADQLLAELEK